MPLLEWERSNVIRHMGYEVQGLYMVSPAGGSFAWGNVGFRFLKAYGNLLYRLNQLKPDEEARILGRCYGEIAFAGLGTNPGDTISVTLSGGPLLSPVSITVTVPVFPIGQAPFSLQQVATSIAGQFTQQAAFTNAGFVAIAPYGTGPFTNQIVAIPICSIIAAPGVTSFTLSASFTGTTVPQLTMTGQLLPPYLSFKSAGQVNNLYGYLPILDFLEAGYLGSSANMSAMIANNVTLRHDEPDQRWDQLANYRQQLARFLGIPMGQLNPAGSGSGQINLVY